MIVAVVAKVRDRAVVGFDMARDNGILWGIWWWLGSLWPGMWLKQRWLSWPGVG